MSHAARCPCGAVRLRVTLTDGLATARRCSCSFCRMRGAVAASAPQEGVEVVAGAEALTCYRFGTGTAEHWFCRHCGIYTHHRRRSDPTEFGVNVACLEGVSPFDLAEVEVVDGINHPKDGTPTEPPVRGVLRFERR